jgi:hypothetical protein
LVKGEVKGNISMYKEDTNKRIKTLLSYISRISKLNTDNLEKAINGHLNKSFIKHNLTDESLNDFDELTSTLLRYESRLNMVGKKAFEATCGIINSRIIINLRYPYRDKGDSSSDYCKEIVDFIYSIDSITDNLKFRGRLIYKIYYFKELGRYLDNSNYLNPKISKLYSGDKLMYISKYEYYYTGNVLDIPMMNVVIYIRNIHWLYIQRILKGNDLEVLKEDLDKKLKNLIQYQIDSVDNKKYLLLRERQLLLKDFIFIFRLKVLRDIMNDKGLEEYYKGLLNNYNDKDRNSEPIINAIDLSIKTIIRSMTEKSIIPISFGKHENASDTVIESYLKIDISRGNLISMYLLMLDNKRVFKIKENQAEMTREYSQLFKLMSDELKRN